MSIICTNSSIRLQYNLGDFQAEEEMECSCI